MRNHITPSSKLAEIKILLSKRKYKDKTFVLLEGKTDIKLFRKLLDSELVQLESLDGKDNVEQVVKSLTSTNPDKVLGICDADFDHLTKRVNKGNVYITDTHDTETMIIRTIGVNSIISEYSKDGYHDGLVRNLLKNSISASYDMGLIKYLNAINDYGLSFKNLNFEDFITVNNINFNFDLNLYIDSVLSNKGSRSSISKQHIIVEFNKLKINNHDQYLVCCGHDVSKIISMILNQKEVCVEKNIDQAKVESLLRVSYGFNDFKNSKLYKSIESWCNDNRLPIFVCK